MSFAYEGVPHPVRDGVLAAQRAAWATLARPGSWWTGAQRVALAEQARAARAGRSEPPWLRELPEPSAPLPGAAADAARTIAADAHKIDRAWAQKSIAALGDAAYVELAALVASLTAIDAFAEGLGVAHEPLPAPEPGEPDRVRNDAVEDAGAYVPLQTPWQGPNVARALSLAPEQNGMFLGLVMSMYGGEQGFYELVWEGAPLTRPQVELLAARVSAVNECFY